MFITDGPLVGTQEPTFEERYGKMSKLQGKEKGTLIVLLYLFPSSQKAII